MVFNLFKDMILPSIFAVMAFSLTWGQITLVVALLRIFIYFCNSFYFLFLRFSISLLFCYYI
jgi:hypothetical protein